MRRYSKGSLLGLLLAGVLAGCATTADSDRILSAEAYLQRGETQLAAGNVASAEMTLDEMELHYPVNVETADLHMGLLHSYHQGDQAETTVLSAYRFINMFPAHADVDFAYYAGGMGNYGRGLTGLQPGEGEEGNPEFAREAVKSFSGLEKCCENSEYAPEARERKAELIEAIAMYELGLMEEEFRSGNEEAGTDRGWYIVSNYADTEAAALALEILSGDRAVGTGISEPVVVEQAETAPMSEPVVAAVPEPQSEPVNFVIQVACYKELAGLKQALSELGLADQVVIERRRVMEQVLYSAIYGGYADEAAAEADVARLKAEFGVADLWLRKASLSEPMN